MGLMRLVRSFENSAIVTIILVSFMKKLARSMKTIISGIYPSVVQIRIRRNMIVACLFFGRKLGPELSRTAFLFAVMMIGRLTMKVMMKRATITAKNPMVTCCCNSAEALSNVRK